MGSAEESNAGVIPSPILSRLGALVGPEHLRAPLPAEAVDGTQPSLVIEPADEIELAAALGILNEAELAVLPRGGGTKLRWGNPPRRGGVVLSTLRLNRVIEHSWPDLTVSVEAGCSFRQLQATLGRHGQRLALDPLAPGSATIGGILSANDSGSLRLRFGGLRDLIIGVTVALPDGTLASSGGRVVKNVAGYDLPKLVTGALGTLGVITRAIFRLHPLPRKARSFSISTARPAETETLVQAVQNSTLAHTALQSRFSSESSPVTDLLIEGTTEGMAAQESQLGGIAGKLKLAESGPAVWTAREELWSQAAPETTAIAKLSFLPADLALLLENHAEWARSCQVRWNAVFQAHGLGWLRLEGQPAALFELLSLLRESAESRGGSLVRLMAPEIMPAFDAWGTPGDALALMKAVKSRLDPKSTLNPGRFLGGI